MPRALMNPLVGIARDTVPRAPMNPIAKSCEIARDP